MAATRVRGQRLTGSGRSPGLPLWHLQHNGPIRHAPGSSPERRPGGPVLLREINCERRQMTGQFCCDTEPPRLPSWLDTVDPASMRSAVFDVPAPSAGRQLSVTISWRWTGIGNHARAALHGQPDTTDRTDQDIEISSKRIEFDWSTAGQNSTLGARSAVPTALARVRKLHFRDCSFPDASGTVTQT